MCPVLLLLLLLAALNPESTAALPDNTTGLKFFVVFPENIAYYHPFPPQNRVRITALYNETVVSICEYTYDFSQVNMNGGDSKEIIVHPRLELANLNITNGSTLQITSNKVITLSAISYRNNSVQSTLVIPIDKLGKSYLIPPTPKITGTTNINVTIDVTERAPFRLIIMNTDESNTVQVQGTSTTTVQLLPNQTALIWLQQQDAFQTVTATHPFAALFGHACAMRDNCTCGLLYTLLLPSQEGNLKYFIPLGLASTDGTTTLLLSEKNSVIPYNPSFPQIQSTNTVILHRPGLLLTLIAEADFASCFVVDAIEDMQTYAVIMVNKSNTDTVYAGSEVMNGQEWNVVIGTDYVWTRFQISSEKYIIWNKSSKMAVYFGGAKGNAVFGNPAPIISKSPDYRGCVLEPEVVHVGQTLMDWRESVQYCQNNGLKLISISNTDLQSHIYQNLIQRGVHQAWIGMRRSSQTGQWYWLNDEEVVDTDWDQGEPGDVEEGQCVIMTRGDGTDFGWSDEDCCKAALPVCYKMPVLLHL